MNLTDEISNSNLSGTFATQGQLLLLRSTFEELVPDWYLHLVANRSLAGSSFSVSEDHDRSGLGVELQWMSAEQIIDEATNCYPGIVATSIGYLPFGICLEGSGDPYFLKIGSRPEDTLVVRIPHDAVRDENLDETKIELVTANLAEFFERSQVS